MQLRAGVGRSCITPPSGIPNGMWKTQRHVRAAGVDLDLWFTALVLEGGTGERVAILDLDLIYLTNAQCAGLRREVSRRVGIAEDHIVPVCTHTHAGPITHDNYVGEGEDEVRAYAALFPYWAASAVARACTALEPVRVGYGKGSSDIGVNRDLPFNGRIVTGPNPDGFVDREVSVLRFDDLHGLPKVAVVNYGCHPTVLGPENVLVSPDYPGSTRRAVEAATGATCLFLQGGAGNVGPAEGFIGDPGVARRLGARLGLEAARVFLTIESRSLKRRLSHIVESGAPLAMFAVEAEDPQPEQALGFVRRDMQLPVRSPLSEIYQRAADEYRYWQEELARRRAAGAAAGEVALAHQFMMRSKLNVDRGRAYAASTTFTAELSAVRIGDYALVACWGEPYSQIGHDIKHRSPFAGTLFAGYTGGESMYIPTPDVYRDPQPFEVMYTHIAPTGAAQVVDEALALLGALREA